MGYGLSSALSGYGLGGLGYGSSLYGGGGYGYGGGTYGAYAAANKCTLFFLIFVSFSNRSPSLESLKNSSPGITSRKNMVFKRGVEGAGRRVFP
jgi:hypothetical protein